MSSKSSLLQHPKSVTSVLTPNTVGTLDAGERFPDRGGARVQLVLVASRSSGRALCPLRSALKPTRTAKRLPNPSIESAKGAVLATASAKGSAPRPIDCFSHYSLLLSVELH